MSRTVFKVHFMSDAYPFHVAPCGQVGLTTGYEPNVTCLRCMALIGRYVPLRKLKEHQSLNMLTAAVRKQRESSTPFATSRAQLPQ